MSIFKKDIIDLLRKENKKLKKENIKLMTQLNDLEKYREDYTQLIKDVKELKQKYQQKISDIQKLGSEYKKELEEITNRNK